MLAAQPGGLRGSAQTETERRATLPDGRVLDLNRSRWDGVLDPEEFEYCRLHGVPLGFDCAQNGWVTQTCTDEWRSVEMPDDRPSPAAAQIGDSGPEHRAAQLRTIVEADTERILPHVRHGQMSFDEAQQRLTSAAADALRGFETEHGISTADLCHWTLQSAVADALGAERGPRHQPPPQTLGPGTITFRPWTTLDATVYVELLGNPNVWEYLPEPFPSPFTEETARTLIEVAAIAFHHEAVAIEVDGRPIGQCLLRFNQPFAGSRAAEVAYWLGEDHWGQGWMSRVLPMFTSQSFSRHRVDVIYAWISQGNGASIRVAQGAGYQRDAYPDEARLAESIRRPGFIRYATYRADWAIS